MKVGIGRAASELGVSRDTLRRWEAAGKITVERTPSGHRRYDLAQLRSVAPHKSHSDRITIAYARVSHPSQKKDLKDQINHLQSFCTDHSWDFELIQDLGSGVNYHKSGLRRLIQRICDGDVEPTALATTLAGGAIGATAGGLTGALVGLGIPEDRARVYNDRVARGDYLVMVDGTEAETRQAEAVLRRHNIHEWSLFDATDGESTRHPQGSGDRLAPDVDPTRRTGEARIEPTHPNVTIIDRRDETRR